MTKVEDMILRNQMFIMTICYAQRVGANIQEEEREAYKELIDSTAKLIQEEGAG